MKGTFPSRASRSAVAGNSVPRWEVRTFINSLETGELSTLASIWPRTSLPCTAGAPRAQCSCASPSSRAASSMGWWPLSVFQPAKHGTPGDFKPSRCALNVRRWHLDARRRRRKMSGRTHTLRWVESSSSLSGQAEIWLTHNIDRQLRSEPVFRNERCQSPL